MERTSSTRNQFNSDAILSATGSTLPGNVIMWDVGPKTCVKSLAIIDCDGNISTPGTISAASIVTDGISFGDNDILGIGDSNDFIIVHNGSNTSLTSKTGNLNLINTNASGTTNITLGSNTNSSSFKVNNSVSTAMFSVLGNSTIQVPTGLTIGTASTTNLYVVANSQATINANLDVVGGIDNSSAAITTSAGFTNTAGEALISGGNLQLNNSIVLSLGTSDNLSITHTGSNATITNTVGSITIANNDTSGNIDFKMASTNGYDRLRVLNSASTSIFEVTPQGSVVIKHGTANGGLNINIGQDSSISSANGNDDYCLIGVDANLTNKNMYIGIVESGTKSSYMNFYSNNSNDEYIAFYTSSSAGAGVERLKITKDGYIGINKSSPIVHLDVVGSATVTATLTSSAISISSTLRPAATNTVDLGSSSLAWKDGYLINAIISLSDRNQKNNISNLDTKQMLKFVNSLTPSSFQLNCGNSGRTHYGFIAQDVEQTLIKYNMNPDLFAPFVKCKNDNGDINYALRYSEFIAINSAAIQELTKQMRFIQEKMLSI